MSRKQKAYLIVFVLSLVILASCFRFYGLTFQSMWLDELLSINHSVPSGGIAEPIRYAISKDESPPLFNMLLWIWRLAFGTGEYSARALPALFGILGVLSMFFLGQELFSAKVGIYASLLTAVLPFHIYYSQEVRPYSLLFLLSALSYYSLLKFKKRKNIKWGLLYVLPTSCMLYTHYFGFLVLFAQLVYLAVVFLYDRDGDKKSFLKSFIPLGVLMALIYLPWIERVRRLSKVKEFWVDISPSDFFISYFKSYFGGELYVVFICLLLMGVYAFYRSEKGEVAGHKVLLFSSVFLVFLVPYFRSFTHAPLLTPRNTIVALPAIVLMVSKGLDRFRSEKFRSLILGTILLMLLINIFLTNGNYYKMVTKEQWREAAKYVLVKDPEGKYPVFVEGKMRYYFCDVFKSGRRLWPEIKTTYRAERASEFISEKKFEGFWVIEAHRRMDKEAQQYLTDQYSLKVRKSLKGARVTFYVPKEPQD